MQMQNKNADVDYDVIVVGAGHAGCEAAWAAARLGKKVLLTTMNLDSVAYLACNPSIGGTAKGHLVCEIDALGGLMGIIADKTAIQIRMLNVAKGAAVFSLRAQADKIKYHNTMKQTLEDIENIIIKQGEVVEILTEEFCKTHSKEQSLHEYTKAVTGIKLSTGETFTCSTVVIATGVYLNSQILIGSYRKDSGPSGFANSKSLTQSLINLGLEIRRFKTGTPPRVNSRTIDFSKIEEQHGDDGIQTFSFLTSKPIKNQILCHITGTNAKTHQIIRENLHQSAMYAPRSESDKKGIGARYCPSIEDKIVRFSDRDRHQIFLEPESLSTNETYLQGISTSLPPSVQQQIVHSIKGLENAQIMRDAYAIEYNCINSLQLYATLEYKNCRGLFFAGQINGTSGYEEAAAQGLVAGVNAALTTQLGISAPFPVPKKAEQSKHAVHAKTSDVKIQMQSQSFTLSRTNSYIGVLIDDLVTVGTDEPYRMFTSRAEHRLYLRQDNADLRLTPIGHEIGLVCDRRWKIFNKKLRQIEKARKLLSLQGVCGEAIASEAKTLGIPQSVIDTVQTELKYEGYIKRELVKIAEAKRCEATMLPLNLDYQAVTGLSSEARTKLNKIHPQNIGQASRITGVTPADINVLLVWLKKNNHRKQD